MCLFLIDNIHMTRVSFNFSVLFLISYVSHAILNIKDQLSRWKAEETHLNSKKE